MSTIAIIGADGMLGRRLAAAICRAGRVAGRPVARLVVADIRAPQLTGSAHGFEILPLIGDMSDAALAGELAALQPDIVFHVAATFMGQADSDFFAGYRINFFTVQAVLEALRQARPPAPPRFVYASSIGVYGPPFPALIDDAHIARPDSSYGTQKLMCELLLDDYSRLGFIDGVGLRLPTLAIRPGTATHGNSGFFSNIIREPLAGRRAELPADPAVRHWLASPDSAVSYLLHAAALDSTALGTQRSLVMPGLSVSVAEMLDHLTAIGGPDARARIDRLAPPRYGPADFPPAFTATRALSLGFAPRERSFAELVAHYTEETAG